MVRDIPYVSLNCKYRDLQQVLHSTKMKSLALVDSAGEWWAGAAPARPQGPHGAVPFTICPLSAGRVHDPAGLH